MLDIHYIHVDKNKLMSKILVISDCVTYSNPILDAIATLWEGLKSGIFHFLGDLQGEELKSILNTTFLMHRGGGSVLGDLKPLQWL